MIQVNEDIHLAVIAPEHATDLLEVVNNNRAHLAQYLPWVHAMQTVADFERYIQQCEKLMASRAEISFVIFQHHQLIGRIGLHHINQQNKHAAIGYWLSAAAGGKGIMINCCRAVITYGFTVLDLKRIEIRAATENLRSKAIPEKLGFTTDGVLRQAELVGDRLYDLAVYHLSQEEWRQQQATT